MGKVKKKDFYGKEIADAIKNACEELAVPQERLDIEVIETGTTGIFGLIRRKAHIKVLVKEEGGEAVEEKSVFASAIKAATPKAEKAADKPAAAEVKAEPEEDQTDELDDEESEESEEIEETEETQVELPEEVPKLIEEELTKLLTLMGYPSAVTISVKGSLVQCHVGEEHEAVLTGQEGKTLDSMQYLLRKIIARKVPHRLRLMVDVGNYREKRLIELKERALELAEKVKADGKTQIIPALSPSERRVIHMSLQDDKKIRSRSVGDGLFKKILIYLPGKGSNKNNGRRRSSRGRRGSRKKSE